MWPLVLKQWHYDAWEESDHAEDRKLPVNSFNKPHLTSQVSQTFEMDWQFHEWEKHVIVLMRFSPHNLANTISRLFKKGTRITLKGGWLLLLMK